MKLTFLFLSSASLALAGCPMAYMRQLAARQVSIPNLPLSQAEGNSGPIDSVTFSSSEQLVNVSPNSGHQYQDPGSDDKRGPCPGLNAAANHNFLPRNGRPNIQQSRCLSCIMNATDTGQLSMALPLPMVSGKSLLLPLPSLL